MIMITRDENGELRVLTPEAPAPAEARAVRCFPWSAPEKWVSLQKAEKKQGAKDGEKAENGGELALVEDPSRLDPVARAALDAALAETSFRFDVESIESVEEEYQLRIWKVKTRQGGRVFETELDDWPKVLPDGGLLMKDVHGDLYRFPTPKSMDTASQAILWPFLE